LHLTVAMLSTANMGVWVGISNCGFMGGGTSKCGMFLHLTVAMLSTANMGVWVGIFRCGCIGGHFQVRNVFAFDSCNAHHCKCGCVGGHFQMWVYAWGHFQVWNVFCI